jgi:hypothetical protein
MDKELKKYYKNYGKWLVNNPDWFTPYRYVSRTEIDEMMNRVKKFIPHQPGFSFHIPIFYDSGWNQFMTNSYCTEPGYYRVEPMPKLENDDDLSYHTTSFRSAVRDGLTLHSRSTPIRCFEEDWFKKERDGEKAKIKSLFQKKIQRMEKANLTKELKVGGNAQSVQFFRTLEMAGSVNKREG